MPEALVPPASAVEGIKLVCLSVYLCVQCTTLTFGMMMDLDDISDGFKVKVIGQRSKSPCNECKEVL